MPAPKVHLPLLLRMSSRYLIHVVNLRAHLRRGETVDLGNGGADLAITFAEHQLVILLQLDEVLGGVEVLLLQRGGDFGFRRHGPHRLLPARCLCSPVGRQDPVKWPPSTPPIAESVGCPDAQAVSQQIQASKPAERETLAVIHGSHPLIPVQPGIVGASISRARRVSPDPAAAGIQPIGELGLPVDPGLERVAVVVQPDQVGALARCDPPHVAQRQELGRMGARHAHRVDEAHSQHAHRVAHRARHVEIGAGEPAVLVDALVAFTVMGRPLSTKSLASAPTLGMASDTSMKRSRRLARRAIFMHFGMHVMSVDDEAAPAGVVRQRRADGAGFAVAELRHGVEQVREAAQARGECRLQFVVGGVGVSRADDDTGIVELADVARAWCARVRASPW